MPGLELKAELIAALRKDLTEEAKDKTVEVMLKTQGVLKEFSWGSIRKLFIEQAKKPISHGKSIRDITRLLSFWFIYNKCLRNHDKYDIQFSEVNEILLFITGGIIEALREIKVLHDKYHNGKMQKDNEVFSDRIMREADEYLND